MAAPPSTMYRFQKFVRRNKGKVLASGLVLLALLAGMAGTSWQWYRAEHSLAEEAVQRKKAEDNERAAETARAEAVTQQTRAQEQEAEAKKQAAAAKAQEAEARKQAAIADAVAKFQTDMLAAVDPKQLPKDPETKKPMKDAVTVLQALEAAVKVLDEGSLKDQPLVEANVRNTIGNTLRALAHWDDAEPNLRKSLAIYRAVLPVGHPDIAAGLDNLAGLLYDQNLLDQNKLAEAEPLLREALEINRAAHPAGHPDIASALNNLGGILYAQNKLAEAEPLWREALEIRRAALPAEHPDIAEGLKNLASLLQSQNKFAEAEPLLREALEIVRAAHPAGHPYIANVLNNLAGLLKDQNKLAEAEPLFRESLEIRRAAFPVGHPNIALGLRNLADLCVRQGKTNEAVPLLREVLESSRDGLPKDSPELAGQLAMVSMTLLTLKAWEEAEPLIREALTIREKVQPDAWTTFNTKSMLGSVLLGQEKYAESEPLLLAGYEGLKQRETTIPPQGKVRVPIALERLVQLYTDWHAAEPDKGHDAKVAEWQQELNDFKAATTAETTPPADKAK